MKTDKLRLLRLKVDSPELTLIRPTKYNMLMKCGFHVIDAEKRARELNDPSDLDDYMETKQYITAIPLQVALQGLPVISLLCNSVDSLHFKIDIFSNI